GIISARKKLPETAEFYDHSGAAFFTNLVGRNRRLFLVLYGFRRRREVFRKAVIEFVQGLSPIKVSVLDLVEVFFHPRRVCRVKDIIETLDQKIVNGRAER